MNINWYLVWWKKYWEVSGESVILAFPLVIIVFIWPYRSFSPAKMLQTGIFNNFLLSSLLHYLFLFHLICIIYTEFSIISVTPIFCKTNLFLFQCQKWKEKTVRWNTLWKMTPGYTHKGQIQNCDWINKISTMKDIHSTVFKIITKQLF